MATSALDPGISGGDTAEEELPRDRAARLARSRIDWRAARQAGRACCCPARPAVVAVMPSAPGRPDPTDLLLCGHHHRASRQALDAAGATVLDMDGRPASG